MAFELWSPVGEVANAHPGEVARLVPGSELHFRLPGWPGLPSAAGSLRLAPDGSPRGEASWVTSGDELDQELKTEILPAPWLGIAALQLFGEPPSDREVLGDLTSHERRVLALFLMFQRSDELAATLETIEPYPGSVRW